jgi:hypothetical protein
VSVGKKRREKEQEAVLAHNCFASSLRQPSVSSQLRFHGRGTGHEAPEEVTGVVLGVYEVDTRAHGGKWTVKLVMTVPLGFAVGWMPLTSPMGFLSQYPLNLLILCED